VTDGQGKPVFRTYMPMVPLALHYLDGDALDPGTSTPEPPTNG
jgi:hypothetical protein